MNNNSLTGRLDFKDIYNDLNGTDPHFKNFSMKFILKKESEPYVIETNTESDN